MKATRERVRALAPAWDCAHQGLTPVTPCLAVRAPEARVQVLRSVGIEIPETLSGSVPLTEVADKRIIRESMLFKRYTFFTRADTVRARMFVGLHRWDTVPPFVRVAPGHCPDDFEWRGWRGRWWRGRIGRRRQPWRQEHALRLRRGRGLRRWRRISGGRRRTRALGRSFRRAFVVHLLLLQRQLRRQRRRRWWRWSQRCY